MTTRIIPQIIILLSIASSIFSQNQEFNIWTGTAPGSENWEQKETHYINEQGQQMIRNVVTPTITVFLPDPEKANGTAMVVAPGGGFRFLSWQIEGTEVADWLVSKGVTAFVLKYRLSDTGTDEEFQKSIQEYLRSRQADNGVNPSSGTVKENASSQADDQIPENSAADNSMSDISVYGQEDGRQAIRVIRQRAGEWNIDPNCIGMMGFSAGGRVTLGPLLKHDAQSRPDFAAAIYTPYEDSPVPDDAPPLFILVAADDALTADGSVELYNSWKAAGKEAELHVYARGGHGFGMQKQNLPVDTWIERLGDWLKMNGLIEIDTKPATSIVNPKTNNRVNPIGIDDPVPVFGWQMVSNIVGQTQDAYQIIVTTDKTFEDDKAVVWNSGRVLSDVSQDISYGQQAKALKAKTRYYWKVIVNDVHGTAHHSDISTFMTGLMDSSIHAWEGAQWIGTDKTNLNAEAFRTAKLEFTLQLSQGSTKAGVIMGANDPRLTNASLNKWLVEGENYIYIEFDATDLANGSDTTAYINIYRKGYCSKDYIQVDNTSFIARIPLAAYWMVEPPVAGTDKYMEFGDFTATPLRPINNDQGITLTNLYDPHDFVITEVPGVAVLISIDGHDPLKNFDFVRDKNMNFTYQNTEYILLNPDHAVIDVQSFPRLNCVGFAAPAANNATITDYKIFDTALNTIIFSETYGATYSIFRDLEGISVDGNSIHIMGGLNGVCGYTDPSFGSTPMLRKTFTVAQGKIIRKAILYVTARGDYQVFINGERVGEDWFNPGYTQYNITMNYNTFDVTGLMINGSKNAIGAYLSSGWLIDHGWNEYSSLLARLEIIYDDGSVSSVNTDETWKLFRFGPVTYSDIWHGETYDARKEADVEGWNIAGYDDRLWEKVKEIIPGDGMADPGIIAKMDEPARVIEIREAKLIEQPDFNKGRDVYYYDLGVNMVGSVQIRFPEGLEGKRIKIRYAEELYPSPIPTSAFDYGDLTGMILTENIRGANATDNYIMKGEKGGEVFVPYFTYHGFRYVEISGAGGPVPDENIKGLVVSSIPKQTVTYESSNKLANQLSDNIMRSLWDNHLSIPTDCNQRDERQGWTGDAQVFSRTATYYGDLNMFYQSWEKSMRDVQLTTGGSFGNAPSRPRSLVAYDITSINAAVCWPAAGIEVVWQCYQQYGSLSLVKEHMNSMMMYMDGVINDHNHLEGYDYLTNGTGLAEHLATEGTNSSLLQNAEIYYLLTILSNMAVAVGEETFNIDGMTYQDKAKTYMQYAEGLKKEWNLAYIDKDGYTYGLKSSNSPGFRSTFVYLPDLPIGSRYPNKQNTQASYALPIACGIVNEINLPKFTQHLIDACKRGNSSFTTLDGGINEPTGSSGIQGVPYTLTTGFVATGLLLPALTMVGQYEEAYKMFEQTKYSSWLYPVTMGATSIWERLNSLTEKYGFGVNNTMNSFEHYAAGAVGRWMINYQLGITSDENDPGFRNFILQPTPGGEFTYLKGSYDSYYGKIVSNWESDGKGNMISYSTTIPANTTAALYLPLGDVITEASVQRFMDITGVTFEGIAIHNGHPVAKFKLISGGYDFKMVEGELMASWNTNYIALP